jgi:hypothetical protein
VTDDRDPQKTMALLAMRAAKQLRRYAMDARTGTSADRDEADELSVELLEAAVVMLEARRPGGGASSPATQLAITANAATGAAWPPPYSSENGVTQLLFGKRMEIALTLAPAWFTVHLRPLVRTFTADEQFHGRLLALEWLNGLFDMVHATVGALQERERHTALNSIEHDNRCMMWRHYDNAESCELWRGGDRCQCPRGHEGAHVYRAPKGSVPKASGPAVRGGVLGEPLPDQCDHVRGPHGTPAEARCFMELGHPGEHVFMEVVSGSTGEPS